MNLSRPFIERPVATVLLTMGLALAGVAAFFALPVAPLPQVDYPVISVSANLPGASPETMASSVTTPLERRLGLIAGLNEMTSTSGTGSARIGLQFDLDRNPDSAARAVQAAINAARADLPATLRSNPGYRKRNPAAAPVIILALTSNARTPGAIYDAAANLVSQRLAQVAGVGEVEIGGGSLPAVRVELLPLALNRYGLAADDVRAAIEAASANRPRGALEDGARRLQIQTQPPARSAAQYAQLIVAWRGGPLRLQDVARVQDGVEDLRTLGLFNGAPAIIVLVTRQPGANVIATVDAVRALLPGLQAQLPPDIRLAVVSDSTRSIRAALREIALTLLLAIALVVLVVALFLRSARATLIPVVAVLASLLGSLAAMYLMGFGLNNLSLMALTVATGFVVDDAIVVLENSMRHIEAGMARMPAALLGAREVGFTVLAISLSLVAVFIPLLFMPEQAGRLLREFALTLSAAVLISLLISLSTTPMLCAWLLRSAPSGAGNGTLSGAGNGTLAGRADAAPQRQWTERLKQHLSQQLSRLAQQAARAERWLLRVYGHALDRALAHQPLVLLTLLAATGLSAWLFAALPKGYFPQQDNGQINAGLRADQSISSQALAAKLRQAVDIIRADPAVATVAGFSGGGRAGGGFMFVNLKPVGERSAASAAVIARLRPRLNQLTGLRVFLNPVQELRAGARASNSSYQYTLRSDRLADLRAWATKLAERLKSEPLLQDVDTDQAENGIASQLTIDRASAARLGLDAAAVDKALYNAFGQRAVASIHGESNQYAVVMEWAPEYSTGPQALADLQIAASPMNQSAAATATTAAQPVNPGQRGGSSGQPVSGAPATMVALSAVAHVSERAAASAINHQGGELATTISFNLAPGATLAAARAAIERAQAAITMPAHVRGGFEGTALGAQRLQQRQLLLILAAIAVIYLVLGVLYESLVHPLTVLSTLPSAGLGAMLALLLFGMEFDLMALIGLLLLIGIVKKNAIMVIDFALAAERRGLSAHQAVHQACLLRLRPILMTTLAAALGALPLVIGFGQTSALRQPLGVVIIGGLLASQWLTLFTTPAVYLLLGRLRSRVMAGRRRAVHAGPGASAA